MTGVICTLCSGAGVPVSWEQEQPRGQAEPKQAPPVPLGGGVIVNLHVQVQVSPYPGNRSGQEVRQSRSKLLQSLRVEVDELRQDILKKKTGTPTPSFQHLVRFTRKKMFDNIFFLGRTYLK